MATASDRGGGVSGSGKRYSYRGVSLGVVLPSSRTILRRRRGRVDGNSLVELADCLRNLVTY